MAALQEFKCPCCEGVVEFDSESQKMKCPYCDSEFEMDALQEYNAEQNEQPQEMSWDTAAGSEWTEGETDNLKIYSCSNCGGQIVADETTGASVCPYCGNNVVVVGQFSGELKPDLVIPFKLNKEAAVAALQQHYNGKVLLPKIFKRQNQIEEVKGVYVPVWLFDTDADATVRYRATKTRHWSDSQYNYTETRYFSVVRAGGIGFENVPVDGSIKMDDALMESIEPFDISGAVDFQTAYLSGYMADKYDVSAEESIERANQRIKNSTESAFRDTVVGYETVTTVSSNICLNNGRARYALYPVWILNTVWNGKKFTFGINGQTGKIAGDLPMDKGLFWKWLISVSGAAGAAAFAISYLVWMFM